MKEKLLYAVWFCLYILCVGLGSLNARTTASHIALMILALLFYVPGILLVWDGIRRNDRRQLIRLRLVCAASLCLTALMMVLTIALVTAGDSVGRVLNDLLNLVSAPMFCCYWRGLSLFFWACLLIGSFPGLTRKKA